MQTVIHSRQNTRVRELRAALAARKTSEVVAIEGTHLLTEAIGAAALGSFLDLQTVFLREDRADLARQVPEETEVVLLSREAFESAAATEHSQGVAALLRRPKSHYIPQRGNLLLVAAGIQDPGNMGTLVRSAEAFGAAAVVLTAGTVDPWNGKALRASAGSAFRMPLIAWSERLHAALQTAGIRLLAAVPSSSGAVAASKADLRSGCAIVIGNEGAGIPEAFLDLCDERITLTMAGRTESLNAAVAGSLLLYEAARQRSSAR